MPFFELTHRDKSTRARAGIIHTSHGNVETPAFMPVGTQASVKTLDQTDLEQIGAPIILGNTYHLHLRPGEDLIAEQGGLHKFMSWDKPILTDSGGFQVFSLGKNQKNNKPTKPLIAFRKEAGAEVVGGTATQARLVAIDEDGVTFTSHLDGSKRRFTPESAIDIQRQLGADIIMAFDECTPDEATREYTKLAMKRTHRWAKRCLDEHKRLATDQRGFCQFLFGIIQGSTHEDLRKESARFISALDFDGIAIGGESIGYNMKATTEILDWVYPLIPENKPHYAMGVGLNPTDLLVAVKHGADMFDCVAPTRLARHGMLLAYDLKNKHRLNINNSPFARDTRPIDENCGCSTCQNYTRSYLHHLFAAEEMTGMRLASIHNLYFLLRLMRQARSAILEDKFELMLEKWRA